MVSVQDMKWAAKKISEGVTRRDMVMYLKVNRQFSLVNAFNIYLAGQSLFDALCINDSGCPLNNAMH